MLAKIPFSFIFLFLLLLIFSAFFSASETAYSSANKIRLKKYADENRKGAKNAFHISQNFDHALSSILIGNNLVNIAAATISGHVAANLFGENPGLVISTIATTVLVLIFGEVLPKSFAKENAETFSLKFSWVLLFIMRLFKPFTYILVKLKEGLSAFIKESEHLPSITEEELKQMVEISEEEGVIDQNEKQLVHNSLDFNDIVVADILTPRTDMIAIDINLSIEEITTILLDERYSRIPVYEGDIDHIIGILSERDYFSSLIKNEEELDIRKILRKPIFVVESMHISKLLPRLQKNRVQMAIVIDEFGGTAGLVTLEDILEELVGEIWDEHDETIQGMKQIESNTYEFPGDYPLDDFARKFNIDLPDSTYHTIGGWLIEHFQEIPSKQEEFMYEHLLITITEAEERRIRKIKVYVQ